jgi:Thiamine pyrophosphate enzyme, N-terminal TPP binding domain
MVPGGLIDRFYPALALTPGLIPIVATHEAGAAYMADGYARARGPGPAAAPLRPPRDRAPVAAQDGPGQRAIALLVADASEDPHASRLFIPSARRR